MSSPDFTTVVRERAPRLDEMALALAAEFAPVDESGALEALDHLGRKLSAVAGGDPASETRACARFLGEEHGFAGNREDYDHPDNSMLDRVLDRRCGLPILLSTVYVEVARRAGVPLAGVGLPGHFVAAHFGADPPLILDPFNGGAPLAADAPPEIVRPWGAHETALRMLNNLVASYSRRGDLTRAIRAAQMRLQLPVEEAARVGLRGELIAMQARLN